MNKKATKVFTAIALIPPEIDFIALPGNFCLERKPFEYDETFEFHRFIHTHLELQLTNGLWTI